MIKKGNLYFPGKEFKKKALVKSATIYKEAAKNPIRFWEKLAKGLFWYKKWKKVFSHQPPYFHWFSGGKINITADIFEENRAGWENIKNRVALIWEPEPLEERERVFTYYQLLRKVNRFANALLKLGVKKGDRVGIYLPMIPEVIVSMLACARIGAVHSVVFSAFSPNALRIRLQDTEAKVLITADGYYRRGKMEAREKKVLLKLEELIHQRIVNQEEAVREIASSLRRARAEISTRHKPMGSFLFLGPTGVGKTETAKALSEYYFGSEKRIIRIDMSEFQQIKDISRLIGSPEHEEGLLTTAVRENPFSLVLLDEIEKAHPDILNLFLQVLDEGFLTDGVGRKVYFRHTIIIATSNAGSDIILERLKEKTDWSEFKEKLLGYLFEKGLFRPEFINRFDGVVVFKPLRNEDLLKIAHLLLEKIKKGLKEKGIDFIITEALKKRIAELSYKPEFGAREMRRVIQRNVENPLASALLSGKLKEGDRVEIDPKDFSLRIF